MYKKEIVKHWRKNHVILVPIFYENETRPAWREVFAGTKKECEEAFYDYPETMKASEEENRKNREYKMKEYLFFMERGDKAKAESIRKQHNF